MTESIETTEADARPWEPPTAPATTAMEPLPVTAATIEGARKILARLCNSGRVRMTVPPRDDDEDMILLAIIELAALTIAEPAAIVRHAPVRPEATSECHGLDTPERVCFYEQDFYVLSNFSSFSVHWCGLVFPTSEHAYHWDKFRYAVEGESDNDRHQRASLADSIRLATSAHEAFKLAEYWKGLRRPDWDAVKVDHMRSILRLKVNQHEYVRRKLLATGDRELVENSWRDDFWGWGPNRDGKNMLGQLWMEIRAELRAREGGHR